MNAITCAGAPGVSDTFASALWVVNTLFAMAQIGVDGVNVHSWRGSAGKLFTFADGTSGWSADVRPEYYGLLFFAQAAPPGSRLLSTTESNGGPVESWALHAPDHTIRVVLINDSTTSSRHLIVSAVKGGGDASLEHLSAPSAGATTGVRLGCQSFGTETVTGTLPGPVCTVPVRRNPHGYAVWLPAASAALLTIPLTPPRR